MILLDTNVISEPLRVAPDSRVVAWLDNQPLETLYDPGIRGHDRHGRWVHRGHCQGQPLGGGDTRYPSVRSRRRFRHQSLGGLAVQIASGELRQLRRRYAFTMHSGTS